MAGPRWRPRGSAVCLRPGGARGASTTSPTARWRATSRGSGEKTTPEEAIAVRSEQHRGAATDDRPGRRLPRSGAGRRPGHPSSAQRPTEGRALYAGLRALDVPEEPVARLWHAATLLREHRGDCHNAALLAHGIGGTEAHVFMSRSLGMRAEEFDRTHHLPDAQPAGVVDRLRRRGLVDAAGSFTAAGRAIRTGSQARAACRDVEFNPAGRCDRG